MFERFRIQARAELAAYRVHIVRMVETVKGNYRQTKTDEKGRVVFKRPYLREILHSAQNLRTELRRQCAYTLAHLPPAWLIALLLGIYLGQSWAQCA